VATAACRQRPRAASAGRRTRDEKTDDSCTDHDERKWQVEEKDTDEGRGREADEKPGFQRPSADAYQRFYHYHEHRGLDAKECALHCRDTAPEGIEQTQAEHHERARQHEQNSGGQPSAHAMQEPSGIRRELLGLRPRQQHAEVKRMQEALLVDPLLLLDQNAMHQRDLAGRAAETDAAYFEPDAKRFRKRNLRRAVLEGGRNRGVQGHPPSVIAGLGRDTVLEEPGACIPT
jgi:hypothetical protein